MAPAVQFLSLRGAAVSAGVERRPLLEAGGEDEHPGSLRRGAAGCRGLPGSKAFPCPGSKRLAAGRRLVLLCGVVSFLGRVLEIRTLRARAKY